MKFLGTDLPDQNPPQIQGQSAVYTPPTTQVAVDQTNNLIDRVSQAQQVNARLSRQSSEAYAQSTVNLSVDPEAFTNRPSDLDSLSQFAMNAYKVWSGIQEEKVKQAKLQRDQLRLQLLPEFQKEQEQLITQSDSIIRGDEGYIGYQDRIESLIKKYKDYLDAEDFTKAYKALYQPAQNLSVQTGKDLAEQSKQIRAQVTNTRANQAIIRLAPKLLASTKQNDPTKRVEAISDFYSSLVEETKDLDPLTQTSIVNTVTEYGRNIFIDGTKEQLDFADKMNKFQKALELKNQALQEFYAKGSSAQSLTEYQDKLAFIEQLTGVSFNKDPLAAESRLIDFGNLVRSAEKAEEAGQISSIDKINLTNAMMGDLALFLANDPTAQPLLERLTEKGDRQATKTLQIIELAKFIKTSGSQLSDLVQQQARIQQAVSSSKLTEIQDIFGWLNRNLQDSTVLQAMGVAAQLGVNIQENVKALLPQLQKNPNDPALKAAVDQIKTQFAELRGTLQTQIKLIEEQRQSVLRQLAPYGLVDPKTGKLRQDFEKGRQSYEALINTIQTLERERSNKPLTVNSVKSNFNMPQLKVVQLGSDNYVLPFEANSSVIVDTGGVPKPAAKVDKTHWNHTHSNVSAVDFTLFDANDNTTVPLFSPVSGKVVSVETGDITGNGITVKDESTGDEYRILHLDKVNLKKGDTVTKNRTELGIQGSTGRSSGPHVHLEIYQNGQLVQDRGVLNKLASDWVESLMTGSGGKAGNLFVPQGTVIKAREFGKVINVSKNDRGTWIEIQNGDGGITRFQGVSQNFLSKGMYVSPGTPVGKSGTLFQWEEFDANKNKLDTLAVAKSIPYGFRASKNGIITRKPSNGVQLDGGFVYSNSFIDPETGKIVPALKIPNKIRTGYSIFNPIREGVLSDDKREYKLYPNTANFGYSALAKDKLFREKLHKVAQDLGIPAIWLADLIDFETAGTWSSSVDNGLGYSGLIQFGDEAAADFGTTRAELMRMSRTEQLDYVQKYLQRRKSDLKSPTHLVAYVWGGGGLLDRLIKTNGRGLAGISDSAVGGGYTFERYMNDFGSRAGRQYQHPWRRGRTNAAIHTRFIAGCPKCENLIASKSNIIPHEIYV